MMSEQLCLLADIGGTNVRLAVSSVAEVRSDQAGVCFLSDADKPSTRARTYQWVDHDSLEDVITHYFADFGLDASQFSGVVLAVAGPVLPGQEVFHFTNVLRPIEVAKIRELVETDQVFLINDFAAQALAVSVVETQRPDLLVELIAGNGTGEGVKSVVGAGTGLGVAAWFPGGSHPLLGGHHPLVIPGEGGNASIGFKVPSVRNLALPLAQAIELYHQVHDSADRSVTPRNEDILSGKGLTQTYAALCLRDGDHAQFPSAKEISQLGQAGNDPRATESWQIFYDCLAQVCSDCALQYLATGGVFIAGGIIPKNLELLDKERFTAHFRNTWHYQDLLAKVSVRLVMAETSGLAGAAVYAGSVLK